MKASWPPHSRTHLKGFFRLVLVGFQPTPSGACGMARGTAPNVGWQGMSAYVTDFHPYRPAIYADLATTWESGTFSPCHGSLVECEAEPGASPPPPTSQAKWIWQLYPTQKPTSVSDPRACQHQFLRPHEIRTPMVCEKLCSANS